MNPKQEQFFCDRCDEPIPMGEERLAHVMNGPDDFDRTVLCEGCWFRMERQEDGDR